LKIQSEKQKKGENPMFFREKEHSLEEVQEILANEDIKETLILKRDGKNDVVIMSGEEYRNLFNQHLDKILDEAEEQIKNGEVIPAEVALKEMQEKYGI